MLRTMRPAVSSLATKPSIPVSSPRNDVRVVAWLASTAGQASALQTMGAPAAFLLLQYAAPAYWTKKRRLSRSGADTARAARVSASAVGTQKVWQKKGRELTVDVSCLERPAVVLDREGRCR